MCLCLKQHGQAYIESWHGYELQRSVWFTEVILLVPYLSLRPLRLSPPPDRPHVESHLLAGLAVMVSMMAPAVRVHAHLGCKWALPWTSPHLKPWLRDGKQGCQNLASNDKCTVVFHVARMLTLQLIRRNMPDKVFHSAGHYINSCMIRDHHLHGTRCMQPGPVSLLQNTHHQRLFDHIAGYKRPLQTFVRGLTLLACPMAR
jgi:hypothetical protein